MIFSRRLERELKRIFATFRGETPGCSIGIARNGKTRLAAAYGMADLEHRVRLSADSSLYLASLSKQFTAACVLLLAEENRLQITDSIRRTISELPACADGITIEHLLTHTSGIRDFRELNALAGRLPDAGCGEDGILRLLARQRALDSSPGAAFVYGNSGYFLLSVVVNRVSGTSLGEFAYRRIFAPLGMMATRFQHDRSALLPRKATGYVWRDGTWHASGAMPDVVGDGGVYSTTRDMVRWAVNFDTRAVAAGALARIEQSGKTTDGTETGYGMGLALTDYDGRPALEHSGTWGGYRSAIFRLPDERLSIVCLSNNASANPNDLVRQVAEVCLPARLKIPKSAAAAFPTGIQLRDDELKAKTGLYRNEQHGYLEILQRGDKLFPRDQPGELIPIDGLRFQPTGTKPGFEAVFDDRNPAESLELRAPGQAPIRFLRVFPEAHPDMDFETLTGYFISSELNAVWRISTRGRAIEVEVGDGSPVKFTNAGADRLRADGKPVHITLVRDASGRVDAFTLDAERARNIQFKRALPADFAEIAFTQTLANEEYRREGQAPARVSGAGQ